eukprot:GFUD01017706.1.p1 GENE.GFUD01017706.1~~GFUD01017706.1.p1  ORF type:complete len:115 (-),score=36.33 GFUD01017706.1:118-462(-)
MSYSGYVYEPPSMTAMKYRRQGYVGYALPGERLSLAREMETNVKGFKEISRDLNLARRAAGNQERVRQSSSMDRTPATSYYKSVVGTRSTKGSGGIFYSEQIGRLGTFSSSRRM